MPNILETFIQNALVSCSLYLLFHLWRINNLYRGSLKTDVKTSEISITISKGGIWVYTRRRK